MNRCNFRHEREFIYEQFVISLRASKGSFILNLDKILEMKMMMKTSLELTDTYHTFTVFFFRLSNQKYPITIKSEADFRPHFSNTQRVGTVFVMRVKSSKIFEYFLSRSLQDVYKGSLYDEQERIRDLRDIYWKNMKIFWQFLE
jgi:hypothetical protein